MARAADRTAAAMLQAEPRSSVLTKLIVVFKEPNFPQKYLNEQYPTM